MRPSESYWTHLKTQPFNVILGYCLKKPLLLHTFVYKDPIPSDFFPSVSESSLKTISYQKENPESWHLV